MTSNRITPSHVIKGGGKESGEEMDPHRHYPTFGGTTEGKRTDVEVEESPTTPPFESILNVSHPSARTRVDVPLVQTLWSRESSPFSSISPTYV